MKRRTLILGGGATVATIGAGAAASVVSMGSSDDYARAMAQLRGPLGSDMREIIRYATLAANGHNTQPWRFKLSAHSIRIAPDFTRRTPIVDPDDHHLYVSLGCAAENLALAARARGLIGEPRFENGGVAFDHEPGAQDYSPLFAAIPQRQTTRAEFDARAVSSANLAELISASMTPGVDLALITERAQLDRVRDLVIASNSAQMADPAFMAELKQWVRFNPRSALEHGDGLYAAASGNPTLPDWLGPILFDLAVTAEAENDKYARQMDSAAGVAVFVAERADPEHWVAIGRACQRFALRATGLGLKLSFVNQPIEVADLRPELASLVGMANRRPDIVLRFGYGPTLPPSPRRPVETVLEL